MEPDPLTDPRCLVTTDALVIDGANGVCRDARLGEASASRALAWLLLAALVFAGWRAKGITSRRRAALVAVTALLAAAPGYLALARSRADAPSRVAQSAEEIRDLERSMRRFARAHGCAVVEGDACAACAPIERLALSGLSCASPAAIELRADALHGACVERGARLVCGASP